MSLNKFETPLDLRFKISRYLFSFLLIIHVLAALGLVLPLSLPWWLRAVMLAMVMASMLFYYRHWIKHPAVTGLHWQQGNQWQLCNAQGQWLDASQRGEIIVLSWLVWMQLYDKQQRRYPLLVLPDMLNSDLFRQLRARLLLGLCREQG